MKTLICSILFWLLIVSASCQVTVVTHGRSAFKKDSQGNWGSPVTDLKKLNTWVFSDEFTYLTIYEGEKPSSVLKLSNPEKVVNEDYNEWRFNCYDYTDKEWYKLIWDLNKGTINIDLTTGWLEYHIDNNYTKENGQ